MDKRRFWAILLSIIIMITSMDVPVLAAQMQDDSGEITMQQEEIVNVESSEDATVPEQTEIEEVEVEVTDSTSEEISEVEEEISTISELVGQSSLEEFSLKKYIAGLYCDPTNIAYHGTLMSYMDSSVSPCDVVLDDLEKKQGFMKTVAAWETATFDPSTSLEKINSSVGYYEAVIMAMLKINLENPVMNTIYDSNSVSLVSNMKDIMDESMKGAYEISLLLNKSNYTAGEQAALKAGFEKWMEVCNPQIQNSSQIIDEFTKGISHGKKAIDLMYTAAEYSCLYYLNEAQKEILHSMMVKCPTMNLNLKQALSELYTSSCSVGGLSVEIFMKAAGTGARIVYSEAVGKLWTTLFAKADAGLILFAQKMTQGFMNLCFNTDEVVEQYYKLRAVRHTQALLQMTILDLMENYKNNQTESNAEVLISSINFLFSLYDVNCDYTIEFADVALKKGVLSSAFSDKDSYEQFVKSVNNMRRYASDSQNFLKDGYWIFLEDDYPEIYLKLKEEQEISEYVPVSEIILKTNSLNIDLDPNHMWVSQATVKPDNATNKKIKFVSGDTSILTVSESGWITPIKEGKTTITVSSFDGAVSAVQEVTVVDSKKEEEEEKEAETSKFKYKLNNDGASIAITGYTGDKTDVVVPGKIDGYIVTRIGGGAFKDCKGLKSINIPDGVTGIDDYAFYGCTSLTSIKIPDGVTNIGDYAFFICKSLTSIKIPDGVTRIGEATFYDCESLTSIKIPDGVARIGEAAFSFCTSLTSIKIPDGVASIGRGAFSCCGNLTSIKISDGVTGIGKDAFSNCTNLISIKIPNGVTRISEGTFYNCKSLTSIKIPDGVKSIDWMAFSECKSLISIEIPDSVMSIGDFAFSRCESLASINIPDSVTCIGQGAFEYCKILTNINIPDSVTNIGYSAFKECKILTIYGIAGSYAESYAKKYNIPFCVGKPEDKIAITTCKISVYSVVYIGKAAIPSVKVTNGSTTLKQNTDYTVAYSNNTKIGTATVVIKGKGKYSGTVNKTFKIIPGTPKMQSTVSASYNNLEIGWNKVAGVTGYIIYRKINTGSWQKIKTVKNTVFKYKDTSVKVGYTYTYTVKAYKKNGSSNIYSSYDKAGKFGKLNTTLSVNSSTIGAAKLSWKKTMGATGYYIYRATSKTGKYSKIKNITTSKILQYTDLKLKQGTTYYYKVIPYAKVNGKNISGGSSDVESVKIKE